MPKEDVVLGCRADRKKHHELYNECREGKDISQEVSLVHSFLEAYKKSEVFANIFDFVSNAKCIKVGYAAKCPEGYYLTLALGNEIGIVGYDYSKRNKCFLFPKSVQNKKISTVTDGLYKILFILSKRQEQKSYKNIEYEIKTGAAKMHLSKISEIEIDII